MTVLPMPATTKSFGAASLIVLATKPVNLEAVTITAANAGENISCYMVGDWWPTATTDKVSRQRKMCQTKTSQALGTTTWETPSLSYTYNPQTIATPGSEGNEAYEALPEGGVVYVLQRLGIAGNEGADVADAYRLLPLELGPKVSGVSADDAGGEFVVNQEVAFLAGYDGPVDGVIAAA